MSSAVIYNVDTQTDMLKHVSPVQVYQVWIRPQMMVLHLSHVCFTLLLFSLEKRCSSSILRLGSSSSGSWEKEQSAQPNSYVRHALQQRAVYFHIPSAQLPKVAKTSLYSPDKSHMFSFNHMGIEHTAVLLCNTKHSGKIPYS